MREEEVFGFVSLKLTKDDVDDVLGVLVDFLYVKKDYRKKIEEFSGIKYSYLMLDYVIETALMIQKLVAINHVYLVPISEEVRVVYQDYGFENIPGSGTNQWEDYMVFNLLDEDPMYV